MQALEQEKAQLSGALEAAEADREDLQQRLSFAQAASPRCPYMILSISMVTSCLSAPLT